MNTDSRCKDCVWIKSFGVNAPHETHICGAVPPSFVKDADNPEGEWMRPRVFPGMLACHYFVLRRDQ